MAFAAPLLAAVGPVLGSAGGVASAASGVLGAVSAITAGNYQAAVAKNNAQIAESNAEREALAAQRDARNNDIEFAALLGEQLAEQGASGLSVDSRSSVALRALTRRTGREQSKNINQAGGDAAQRLKQDAANFRGQAKAARTQGYLNAAGSILGSVKELFPVEGSSPSLVKRRSSRRVSHGNPVRP